MKFNILNVPTITQGGSEGAIRLHFGLNTPALLIEPDHRSVPQMLPELLETLCFRPAGPFVARLFQACPVVNSIPIHLQVSFDYRVGDRKFGELFQFKPTAYGAYFLRNNIWEEECGIKWFGPSRVLESAKVSEALGRLGVLRNFYPSEGACQREFEFREAKVPDPETLSREESRIFVEGQIPYVFCVGMKTVCGQKRMVVSLARVIPPGLDDPWGDVEFTRSLEGAHDALKTVMREYWAAMVRVEKGLRLPPIAEPIEERFSDPFPEEQEGEGGKFSLEPLDTVGGTTSQA